MLEDVITKYPAEYTESINTVLTQEVIRYNKLLVVMADTLMNFQKALIGEIVMSEYYEKIGNSLFDNKVPELWEDVGFLSLKPLASWIQDLNYRIKFLSYWIEGGNLLCFRSVDSTSHRHFWQEHFKIMQENILLQLMNFHSSSRYMMIFLIKMWRKKQKMVDMSMECILKAQDGIQIHICLTTQDQNNFTLNLTWSGSNQNKTETFLILEYITDQYIKFYQEQVHYQQLDTQQIMS